MQITMAPALERAVKRLQRRTKSSTLRFAEDNPSNLAAAMAAALIRGARPADVVDLVAELPHERRRRLAAEAREQFRFAEARGWEQQGGLYAAIADAAEA